jgi:hypothetical protein
MVAGLLPAGLGGCSSDRVVRSTVDGGDAAASGGTSGAGGRGGNGASPSSGGKGGPSGGGVGGAAAGCAYGGATHPVGSTFPSTDGCNTCTCGVRGAVSCTKRACIPDAGADAASACTETPAARLCVRGPTSTSAGEPLKVGDKLKIQVEPRGCFSSSCTEVRVATCTVSGTAPLAVDAHFCLASSAAPGVGCTADCAGGGFAVCAPAAALTAGQHTVKLGGLSVTFSVPGNLPAGGECIGAPF